jgi:hypothetical protein
MLEEASPDDLQRQNMISELGQMAFLGALFIQLRYPMVTNMHSWIRYCKQTSAFPLAELI